MSLHFPDPDPLALDPGACALCQRSGVEITRHHLIPRTYHRDFRRKQGYSREILNRTIPVCPPCHRHIHQVFTEKQLARQVNTLEQLRAEPEIQRFVAWIQTKRADLKVKFG